MTSDSLTSSRSADIPVLEIRLVGRVCLVLLALLGVGALAGGIALASQPDGSIMGFDVALLAGSPFTDFLIPGLILGVLFGVGSIVTVGLGVTRARLAPFLAFALGVGMMIWIAVELAIIHELSFLHPICFGIGLLIAGTAIPWAGRPSGAGAPRSATRSREPKVKESLS